MATTTTATRIGFVGLGNMGGSMAARFLAAGYPVYGEDQDRDRARGLMHDGLEWRRTPREVAEAADVVFTSVPDDNVLELVASGPEGILAGLAAGKTWVDMSTVSPNVSREIAKRVHALGATMLDAPVSGSVPQVQAGTLTIMVGGDKQAYTRVEPILRAELRPTSVRTGRASCSSSRSTSVSPCKFSRSPRASFWLNAPESTASSPSM